VGAGKTASSFIKKILANKGLGFEIVGYINPKEVPDLDSATYLGKYSEMPSIISENAIDQIYICLDSNQQSDLKEINHHLAEQMIDLNIVPDIYNTLNINPEILDLDGMPIIALRQSSVDGWNRIFKRTFDLVGSTAAILLLLPVWIILPVLIKLTSPGPVFYLQERMGLDGKSFNMIKFRSMRVDAESETGAVWATKDDDRKTKLGAFMRKTSLDEFPQFFNVFQGAMSLVGPRPERPVFISEFKTQIPNYMLRHKMKAGITGWAQVNGWRGNTSLEKRIEHDIYYLTHWSILFDIKIMAMTVVSGIINPNAY
jgi:Undecaprenyl-phosphate glucose phosphotransferase